MEERFKTEKWKIELVNSFFGIVPGNEEMNSPEKDITVFPDVSKEEPVGILCSEGPLVRGTYIPRFFKKWGNIGPSEYRTF